jgi:hypothetical protein
MSKNNYIKDHIIERINPETGELEHYKEIYNFRRTKMSGYRMIYPNNLEHVLINLQGSTRQRILFYIARMFNKNKPEVMINQARLAKKFKTTKQYINTVMIQLVDLGVLLETRRTKRGKFYRFNPYLILPAGPDELHVILQYEWDMLTSAPSKIKNKFEYLYYLQSDEWKELSQRVKEKAGWKCSECGSRENLEVHHLTYDRLFNECIEDLVCLCSQCHENRHREEK